MSPDNSLIKQSIRCLCPKCGQSGIYKPGFLTFSLKDQCENCGINLADNDSADGPAVFLIFILGFLLVPLALMLDSLYVIPLWLHAVVWTAAALLLTLGMLKPLKAYVIALQFKHRRSDWE